MAARRKKRRKARSSKKRKKKVTRRAPAKRRKKITRKKATRRKASTAKMTDVARFMQESMRRGYIKAEDTVGDLMRQANKRGQHRLGISKTGRAMRLKKQ